MDTITLPTYDEFVNSKRVAADDFGFEVAANDIHPALFGWQALTVRWALKRGRAALFEDCGMGKTRQQLEWARHVAAHTGGKVLILAPLAVAHQTVAEGKLIDLPVKAVRSMGEATGCTEQVVITNYDMLHEFDGEYFAGVVLDESSILKSFTGATKRMLLDKFAKTPYRLACTATPAPNDHLELGNHAEFLGVMNSDRMISRWFVNDSMQSGHYRLRGHAEHDFWQWVTGWAICLSKPSDLDASFSDDGYILPPVNFQLSTVAVDHSRAFENGKLFFDGSLSATAMWADKRVTAVDRCERVRALFDERPNETWVIWCDTNDEADMLIRLFAGTNFVEVRGSQSVKEKEEKLSAFSSGKAQIVISKADIAGHGLNWQHCHNTAYTGLTYSFEKLYQSMRRLWRFGQTQTVNVYLVYAETEGGIMATLNEKQKSHHTMQSAMNTAMAEHGLDGLLERKAKTFDIGDEVARGAGWDLYLGDCVQNIREVASESIDYSLFSPPFSTLYIYSDLPQDMGNCQDDAEFFQHYRYLLPELARVTKPGGYSSVHCKDLPLYKNRDGAAGLRDFPGQLIEAHESAGWLLWDKVTIWKDPVIEMQRTKNHGLLWKNFMVRGEVMRQGMADYMLEFVKPAPGQKLTPHKADCLNSEMSPDFVARCMALWSNPGEVIALDAPTDEYDLAVINLGYAQHGAFDWQGLYDYCKPGRVAVLRVKDVQLDAGKKKAGLLDVSGMVIRQMSAVGFTFQSRCFVSDGYALLAFRKWTDEMPGQQVNHSWIVPGEYVGDNPPLHSKNDRHYSIQVWQRYASPVWNDLRGLPAVTPAVWFDVDQTNVLNFKIARENQDEKHICPLQLDVADKSILKFTKPGDVVLSPFAGVGSEGYEALKLHRQFVGFELKQSYFNYAIRNLQEVELANRQLSFA